MITASLLKSSSAIALVVAASAALLPSAASAQTVTVWDGGDTTGDGQTNGGSGTWTANGTNWTNITGTVNGPYNPNGVLIFRGTGGTVTVDNSAAPIAIANGIQFTANGYTLTGGALQLTAPTNALAFGSTIRVGDGTAAGAAITANIASALTGPSGMLKTDLGTLQLTGANTYFGETRVLAGSLIQSGGTLGGTTAESALRVAIDPGSTASLAVINGAVLTSTTASIATQTNSTGTVTVSGAGSRWSIVGQGQVRVGNASVANSRGLVEILDGGALDFNAGFSFAPFSVEGGSRVRVSGAGSRFDAAAIMLFNQGGGGALTLENGGVARAENFEFGNTSALTIRSGARLETTGTASLFFNTGSTMLVTGTGSRINSAGPFSFGGNTVRGGDLIIEDNAIVTSSANTDSGLGFDSGRNMIVSSGAQFNLTGGISAGLQMESSNLLVDNASVTMGGGFNLGQRFGSNTVTLLNANLTAGSITARNSVINIGGTRTGAAGAVGIFNVADVSLIKFDSGVSAELNFNHTSNRYVIASRFAQNGIINLIAGNTVFTGDSAGFSGSTIVSGGSLIVNNRFGTSLSVVGVGAGATLGGTGTVGGTVTVNGGTIAAGDSGVGTLIINGALILDAASRLAFQLGAPNTPGVGSDLINVTGNLTLDGTADITNAGSFGAGLYRLIDYSGTLTNNGLDIGAVPTGFAARDLTVQTATARQVNLLVGVPAAAGIFNFWDGANIASNALVDGGTGTWTTAGGNWTLANGSSNGAYDPNALLIFSGAAGTVTVDNSVTPIPVANGMQFATNGYTLTGGALQLTAPTNALAFGSTIRVGDGTAAGAAITANIATALTGPSGMIKTDLGTLRLTGANTYFGETRVLAGNLIQSGGTLGGTAAESALRVAIDPGSTASLAVTNGAVLTSTAASIATQTNSTGTVTVSGAGSRWNIVGSGGVRIGGVGLANSRGLVEILDGGVLNFSPALLSVAGGSTIRVSGAGSRFDAAATILFNQGGGGALTLESGGVARAENFEFGETSALTVRSGARLETTIGSSLTFGTGATMLVTGTGSRINSAGPFSFGGNTVRGGDLIIEDNAIVTSSANTDSGLGFDSGRNMIVRSGGQFNLTGGTGAGLQMENSNLLVDDASVTMGGNFLLGSRFGNNTVTLLNANLTAASITARDTTVFNIGGTRTGAAGAVGNFVAPDVTIQNGAEFNFNHISNRYVIASQFASGSSAGGRINLIAGTTVFTGDSAGFTGNTQVTGGSLIVNNRFGTSLSMVGVGPAATLAGTGTVGGTVTVTGGTIAAGDNGVGTLTIGGALVLDAASRLAFQLGAPNTAGAGSDLINVTGNLTLDGTVNLANVGGFGAGLYRLINYGGTLTDNGLAIGLTPMGFDATNMTVQTSIARQINLLVATPVSSFSFWDGANSTSNNAVDGGAGTWTSAGTNWTIANGATNGAYDRSALLIFSGTGGIVTVDNSGSQVTLENGVQFAADGYAVSGGSILLDDRDTIIFRVGDGTASGAAFNATIGSALSGDAKLQKTDLGTLVLTGANTYRGGTQIVDGAIRGNTTSIRGAVRIEDNGTLIFDQANNGKFAGTFSGNGVVRTRGSGILEIDGTLDDFKGRTVIESGTLRMTGALGGLTIIGTSGALTGNGTLAQLDVSGRISPGEGSIATLTVDDINKMQAAGLPATKSAARITTAAATITSPDLLFRSGSIYAVDLAATGAADRINVAGKATLQGGTVAITTLDADLAYTDGSVFRILNAEGGLTGTFAGLTENSAFLDFSLGYDPTGAFLRLAQIRMFPDVAKTINQRAVASALSTLSRPAGSDGLAVYNAVLGLDSDAARAAFDASSGEIYASLLASRQRQGFALTSRFTSRAQADLGEGVGIWGGITGHDGRIAADNDRNAGRVSSDGIGGEIGIDFRGDNDDWAVGFGGGWQDGNVNLAARSSYAKNETWHVGGYVRMGNGGPGFTVLATAVHARADTDIARAINFAAVARTATSNTDISTTALGVDMRYGWGTKNWSLGPAASIGLAKTRFSAFTESSAGTLNLSGTGSRDRLNRYGVGGFLRYSGAAGYIDLTAYHVSGDRSDARATLSMAGSPQRFTVFAPRGSKSAFRLSASSQYDITKDISLGGNVGLNQGSEERDVYGHVRVSYRF